MENLKRTGRLAATIILGALLLGATPAQAQRTETKKKEQTTRPARRSTSRATPPARSEPAPKRATPTTPNRSTGRATPPARSEPAPKRATPTTPNRSTGRTTAPDRSTGRTTAPNRSTGRSTAPDRSTGPATAPSRTSPAAKNGRARVDARSQDRSAARTAPRGATSADRTRGQDSQRTGRGTAPQTASPRVDRRSGSGRGNAPGNTRIDGRRNAGARSTLSGRNDRAGNRVRIPYRGGYRTMYHVPRPYYTPIYVRRHYPTIHVHLAWPWVVRYERHWSPRYRYRQVIRIETVIAGRREYADVEVETYYRHRVRYANDDVAEIEIDIDRIEVYADGRYMGYVDRIPQALAGIRASVYRDGRVRFDRDVFLMGDPYVGFEMLSTRAYDGWVLDEYRPNDGYRVGRLDLANHRVRSVRSSRLFRARGFDGLVPLSLLPERDGWLWDYGVDALSAYGDDYDGYYGGAAFRAPDVLQDDVDEWEYQTRNGADILMNRESSLQRVR